MENAPLEVAGISPGETLEPPAGKIEENLGKESVETVAKKAPFAQELKPPYAEVRREFGTCSAYLSGLCADGDACSLFHDLMARCRHLEEELKQRKLAGPCQDYIAGKCSRGVTCQFFHDRQAHCDRVIEEAHLEMLRKQQEEVKKLDDAIAAVYALASHGGTETLQWLPNLEESLQEPSTASLVAMVLQKHGWTGQSFEARPDYNALLSDLQRAKVGDLPEGLAEVAAQPAAQQPAGQPEEAGVETSAWEVETESGWTAYDQTLCAKLDSAVKEQVKEVKTTWKRARYVLNLENMTQSNERTGTTRKIRKVMRPGQEAEAEIAAIDQSAALKDSRSGVGRKAKEKKKRDHRSRSLDKVPQPSREAFEQKIAHLLTGRDMRELSLRKVRDELEEAFDLVGGSLDARKGEVNELIRAEVGRQTVQL